MKPRVVVLGASGHAKVVIEILEEMGSFDIAGCTCASAGRGTLIGYPILGGDEVLPELLAGGVEHAFVAIGDNRIRRDLAGHARNLGFKLVTAVSRSATISARARLGEGVTVMPGATINVDTWVGDGAIINTGATVDHDCVVGAYAHIAPGVHLAGNVTIGEGTFLGVGGCLIPGVTVGAWSVIGAGAAVIGDLDERVTAVGVPARIIRSKT